MKTQDSPKERGIRGAQTIVEAHQIAGPYDYALRFLGTNRDVWNAFQQHIESIGSPVRIRFGVLMESLK